MSSLFPEENEQQITKKCIYCNEEKCLKDFPKHIHYVDNLDNRCRECIKKHSKIRSHLHKTSPPKPKKCQCCNLETTKLVLDHNHNTNTFRGWLCDACNTGIGKLGDDLQGLKNAIKYLKKSERKNEQKTFSWKG